MEQIADNARADSPAVKKKHFNSVDPIDLIQIIYDKIKYLYNTCFDEVCLSHGTWFQGRRKGETIYFSI